MSENEEVPEIVSVTGTSITPDTPVTMLEGATGARIPTGEHRRSGAMPSSDAPGTPQQTLVMAGVVAAVAIALVVVAVLIVANA